MTAGDLFDEHQRYGWAVLRTLCRRHGLRAEDFAAAAMGGMWAACRRADPAVLARAHGRLQFRAYLAAYVRGAVLSQIRQEGGPLARERTGYDLDRFPAPERRDPAEAARVLARLLARLDLADRWVLTERLKGRTYADLARELGVTREAVRIWLVRAMRRARDSFRPGDDGGDEDPGRPAVRRPGPPDPEAWFEDHVRAMEEAATDVGGWPPESG